MPIVGPHEACRIRQHQCRLTSPERNRPGVPGDPTCARTRELRVRDARSVRCEHRSVSQVVAVRQPHRVAVGQQLDVDIPPSREPGGIRTQKRDHSPVGRQARLDHGVGEVSELDVLRWGRDRTSPKSREEPDDGSEDHGGSRCSRDEDRLLVSLRPAERGAGSPRDGVSVGAVATDPLQIGSDVRGRLVACLTILLEQPVDDALKVRMDLWIPLSNRRRCIRQQFLEDDCRRWTVERTLPRRALIEDDAQRPEIGACVNSLSTGVLRRHVRGGADHGPRGGDRRFLPDRHRVRRRGDRRGRQRREPEVEDFHLPCRRDEQIGRLDVAMDDPHGMCGGETVCNLNGARQQLPIVGDEPDGGAIDVSITR